MKNDKNTNMQDDMSYKLEQKKFGAPAFSVSNKVQRVIWALGYFFLFRYTPKTMYKFRAFILRIFGANIGSGTLIHPSVKIWLPANLTVAENVAIAENVELYNQGHIFIGKNSIVSQGSFICASTHDYTDPIHPLVLAPIVIGEDCWICAQAFVGPGVFAGNGTVLGARCVLTKDTIPFGVYVGNPAVKIKQRIMK